MRHRQLRILIILTILLAISGTIANSRTQNTQRYVVFERYRTKIHPETRVTVFKEVSEGNPRHQTLYVEIDSVAGEEIIKGGSITFSIAEDVKVDFRGIGAYYPKKGASFKGLPPFYDPSQYQQVPNPKNAVGKVSSNTMKFLLGAAPVIGPAIGVWDYMTKALKPFVKADLRIGDRQAIYPQLLPRSENEREIIPVGWITPEKWWGLTIGAYSSVVVKIPLTFSSFGKHTVFIHGDYRIHKTGSTPLRVTYEEKLENVSAVPKNQPPIIDKVYSIPSNGDRYIGTKITLDWKGSDPDGDAVTYDVYINGKIYRKGLAKSECSFRGDFSKKYKWRVVATDEHGATTKGPTWQFTTISNSIPPEILKQYDPLVFSSEWPYGKVHVIKKSEIWDLRGREKGQHPGKFATFAFTPRDLSSIQLEIVRKWVKRGATIYLRGARNMKRKIGFFNDEEYDVHSVRNWVCWKKRCWKGIDLLDHPIYTDVRDIFAITNHHKYDNKYRSAFRGVGGLPEESEVLVKVKGIPLLGYFHYGKGTVWFDTLTRVTGRDADRFILNLRQWLIGGKVPPPAVTE